MMMMMIVLYFVCDAKVTMVVRVPRKCLRRSEPPQTRPYGMMSM
jgi:hypothetical protein